MKLIIVFAVVLLLFFYVWEESQALKLVGQINQLKKEIKYLNDEHKRLVAQAEINSTLPLIEQKALALGLRHSAEADIIGIIIK